MILLGPVASQFDHADRCPTCMDAITSWSTWEHQIVRCEVGHEVRRVFRVALDERFSHLGRRVGASSPGHGVLLPIPFGLDNESPDLLLR